MSTRKFPIVSCLIFFLFTVSVYGQDPRVRKMFGNATSGLNGAVAQDKLGNIWYTSTQNALVRYDSKEFKTMLSSFVDTNQRNLPTITTCMIFDKTNILWMGFLNTGLGRYDMTTNQFTRYKHSATDPFSISSDTVTSVLEDSKGNLWIGTFKGLNLLDRQTGRFTRYENQPGVATSLSHNHVTTVYEDKQRVLWVGTGSSLDSSEAGVDGGLNKFDRGTGAFTRYKADPGNSTCLVNNKVRALFEDSKGNFWVGTAGDGLHIMNRKDGTFKHYPYDPKKPQQLSRPPVSTNPLDHIIFFAEDSRGGIWISTALGGMARYDPDTKKIDLYGRSISADFGNTFSIDPKLRLDDGFFWQGFKAADNSLWFVSFVGNVFNVNFNYTTIPFYDDAGAEAYSFYVDTETNTVWVGTSKGLIQKSADGQILKTFRYDVKNHAGIPDDYVNSIRVDKQGRFWLATSVGVSRFDRSTGLFTNYLNERFDPKLQKLKGFYGRTIAFDSKDRLWIGGEGDAFQYLDINNGTLKHYPHSDSDTNTISGLSQYAIIPDSATGLVWIATEKGLDQLDPASGRFIHFLKGDVSKAVFIDHAGVVWAGSGNKLYYMKPGGKNFSAFDYSMTDNLGDGVLHIMEDNLENLWVDSRNYLLKLSPDRTQSKRFGMAFGIPENKFSWGNNYKAPDGKLYFGDQHGHYAFYPEQLPKDDAPPLLLFTNFWLNDREIKPGMSSVLHEPIWKSTGIKLTHDQNVFSLDFISVNYLSDKPNRYYYMLENFDNNWHGLESYHKAVLVNIPPGDYIFHARVITDEGSMAEKTLRITITPPWWKTSWAYALYFLLGAIVTFMANRFIRNRIIEKERARSREKELQQAKEIEKAYTELKATQAQLIQSEKMASLGQLTAGIAHEIQNPLNFVNNFADINNELIEELKNQPSTSPNEEREELLNNIYQNNEKISHHGKRADSIVKGMLQHSRAGSGQKELTDINNLADEYLRLAYHGKRARDKSFNVTIETDFDPATGSMHIAPQDISRVLLNLYNNAFDAMNEKMKLAISGYAPVIKVQSRRAKDHVEIIISDNGNGIPATILDKIFQPFFTTKPSGQGTGLGLSLSYDIVKTHNGTLKVESMEGEYSRFTLSLPL